MLKEKVLQSIVRKTGDLSTKRMPSWVGIELRSPRAIVEYSTDVSLHIFWINTILIFLSALYNRTVVPYQAYNEMEKRWSNMIQNVLVKESILSTLAPADSMALIQTNVPILQIFIQVYSLTKDFIKNYNLNYVFLVLLTFASNFFNSSFVRNVNLSFDQIL